VDPRAGVDDLEKRKFLTLPGLELRPLSRPARSQSLYRLSYPGSYMLQQQYYKINNMFKQTYYSLLNNTAISKSEIFRRLERKFVGKYSGSPPPGWKTICPLIENKKIAKRPGCESSFRRMTLLSSYFVS
jgi:hypothetical protein